MLFLPKGLASSHRYLSGSRTPPNQAEAGLAGAPWDTAVTPAVTPALSPGCAAKAHGKSSAPQCSKEHVKFYVSP